MAKRVIWSKEALADRILILDYWYQRLGSKDYSLRLDDTFRNAIRLLSQFLNLGRQLEYRDERFFFIEAYQIFIWRMKSPLKLYTSGTHGEIPKIFRFN